MALTPDEAKLLEQLNAKLAADDADDFEVEIFSGDKGARVPMSKAAKWLFTEFGIGDDPAAGKPPAGGAPTGEPDPSAGPVRSLFRPGGKAAGQGGK